jgi:GH24 family phage-related lysozyme (muramidase)
MTGPSINSDIAVSTRGTLFIANWEGLRRAAYDDGTGVWTIGYGHTRGVEKGDECTREQALEWLREDIEVAATALRDHITAGLSQTQFDALASFTYNVGENWLHGSHLLSCINAHNWRAAGANILEYCHAGNRIMLGLVRRRHAERRLFLEGHY